jgi:hypothetical protein
MASLKIGRAPDHEAQVVMGGMGPPPALTAEQQAELLQAARSQITHDAPPSTGQAGPSREPLDAAVAPPPSMHLPPELPRPKHPPRPPRPEIHHREVMGEIKLSPRDPLR